MSEREKHSRNLSNGQRDLIGKGTGVEAGITGRSGLPPGMTKEYSGWDVYNNEAKKVDMELVKDWTTNLNSLLLFAAIFAAILTGFIIESKKMLELNSPDVMMDVLIRLTNNLANGTQCPYLLKDFQAPPHAVTINSLFFASLSTSLVAALASIVALQWVADYDAAMARGGSSPEDLAKNRQFRHAGVVLWKMSEIIAAIPLFLYCSVILFFSGLILWMWIIHSVVGAVVAAGAAVVVLFYGGSTFLAVIFVSAPFRTPLSRWIYSFSHFPFTVGYWVAQSMHLSSSILVWLEDGHLRGVRAHKREETEVVRREKLGIAAMIWLANQVSVSRDSYHRLILLVGELPRLKRDTPSLPGFGDAPWFLIFDLLGWIYSKEVEGEHEITAQEMRNIDILAQCYVIPEVHDIIRPNPLMNYVTETAMPQYWSQCCQVDANQWFPNPRSATPNSLYLYLRDLPLPSRAVFIECEATTRLSKWRNSNEKGYQIWMEMLDLGIAASPTFFSSYIKLLARFIQAHTRMINKDRTVQMTYTAVIDRIVWLLIKEKAQTPDASLNSLLRGFQSLLMVNHDVDIETPFHLSNPLLYRKAVVPSWDSVFGNDYLHKLHCAFTLLLATRIKFASGIERRHRFKEVLIMLWVANPFYFEDLQYPQGDFATFFEVNTSRIMLWAEGSYHIRYIHEILSHLIAAQMEDPDVGPLWRMSGDSPVNLCNAIASMQLLITRGVTSEQHCTLIHLLWQGLGICLPQKGGDNYNSPYYRDFPPSLSDPCLRTLAELFEGSNTSFSSSFVEITGS